MEFKKYVLSIYYVSRSVLDMRATMVKEVDFYPCFFEFIIYEGVSGKISSATYNRKLKRTEKD